MIDPIGTKPGPAPSGRIDSQDAAKVVPITAVRASQPAAIAETSARDTARALAAKPPVNLERVQQIKKALADGRYPIVPATIADRLIAAQFRWIEEK